MVRPPSRADQPMTLPQNLTIVPKNDYFTYFSANGETYCHRQSDQIWNTLSNGKSLVIQVSGAFQKMVPSKNGPVAKNETNFFAKKHLIVTKSQGADDVLFAKKTGKVMDARFEASSAQSINDKRNKQLNTIAKSIGGKADATNRNLASTVFEKRGYGPIIDKTKVAALTFVYLNMLSQAELLAAFAAPLATAGAASFATREDLVVDFGKDCVFKVAADQSGSQKGSRIQISAYFESVAGNDIKVHVYHLHDMV
jgi:hypothetical protein